MSPINLFFSFDVALFVLFRRSEQTCGVESGGGVIVAVTQNDEFVVLTCHRRDDVLDDRGLSFSLAVLY